MLKTLRKRKRVVFFLAVLLLLAVLSAPRLLKMRTPVLSEEARQFFLQVRSDQVYNNNLVFCSEDHLAVGDQLVCMDGDRINLYGPGHTPELILNTLGVDAATLQLYSLWPHLYFDDWRSDSLTLYDYHLETQKLQKLCQVPKCRFWAVTGDSFVYLVYTSFEEQEQAPLHIRDLVTGEDRQICPAASSFGLVEGELRYVSYREEDDCYDVYRYDESRNISHSIGSFPALLGKNCQFQFCPDKIVMARYGTDVLNRDYDPQRAMQMVVYDLPSESVETYSLPADVYQLIAADSYAYAVVYKIVGGGDFGIYRIDLENGELHDITPTGELGGVTILWVESDERAYIMQFHGFSNNAWGSLHRYDADTDQTEFLCWLD